MTQEYYRLLDHTADLGVEFFGSTPEQLFANAAHGLAELLCEPETIQPARSLMMAIDGEDWPDLMVNWLRELLFIWNGRRGLWLSPAIDSLTPNRLEVEIRLDSYDPDRHRIRREIKAVTYHDIQVTHGDDGWKAKVIFDV